MKKFLKKYWVFFMGLIISTLMNFPHLIPSYYLDGYCSLCEGFSTYALTFVKAGRYLTAAIYYFIDLIKLNPAIFSILSIVLSNVILSIAMQIIYKDVTSLTNDNKKTKLVIFLGAFLICFNPFNIEYFLFEESFAICLGFLLTIIAGSIFSKEGKYAFIKSLGILFLATCFYQSTLSLFIPYVFLITCLKNKNQTIIENIKKNYLFYIKGLFCYGISLVLSFISLKLVLLIFNLNSAKFGELNIITNIKIIISLFQNTIRSLHNMINTGYFYGLLAAMLFMYVGYILLDFKNNYTKLIYIVLMISLCLVTTFVPNLAMNSLANYTAARMACSIGSINGFILLMSLLFKNNNHIDNYSQTVLSFIGICIAVIYSVTYLNAANDNLNRYNKDSEYIANITNTIEAYEKKHQKIENIKFVISNSAYYYYNPPYNSMNIRVNAVDWGINCILKNTVDNNLNITQITEDEILKLTLKEGINFKYKFDENTMYLLIW